MGKIMKDGQQYGVGGIQKAESITYDNTDSGMTATNVQGAVDTLNAGLTHIKIASVIFDAINAYGIDTKTVDVSSNPATFKQIVGWRLSNTTFLVPIQLYFSDTNKITCRVTNFTNNAIGAGVPLEVYYI